ncbi:MAG: response regulator, partial [Deltaproteobacteria bacterium]|nr:response regulator [Deltaproteobacteria bacterium]
DLEGALDVCLEGAVRIAEGDGGAIMLPNEVGAFETTTHRGLPADYVDRLGVLGPDTGHVRLIAAGKPVFSTHAILTRNWDARLEPGAFRAVGVIPLVHEDRVVGCLTVISFSRDEFAPRRREALVGAASQIAQTIVRWRAEKERMRLEEQLRAAAKMEAIGRLAGGVAHDFNNILTSIRGYAELLLRSVREEDPMAEDLQEITKAADRAASLTQQLLAFSRKQIIEPRVIDLNDVIENSARMLKRMIGEDVDLIWVPDAHLTPVRVDPVQMEQVLINLAVNARDAMPDGGRLTIATANAAVDRDYASRNADASPGMYVMMSVRDTGHGMSDEVRERIFEPFFTTKEQGKGTGLGLATVYGIARQNGGFITVDSQPGAGSDFRFYLPAASEPAHAPKSPESPTAAGGAEAILVVEDEDAVRRLAKRVLERNGYRVIEAASGDEALAVGDDVAIDLVLTDVVMPHMNGRQLVEKLLARRPGLRVVFMSGYTEDAIARHGVLEDGTAFLQKPFTAADLARKIREALDR